MFAQVAGQRQAVDENEGGQVGWGGALGSCRDFRDRAEGGTAEGGAIGEIICTRRTGIPHSGLRGEKARAASDHPEAARAGRV